MSLRLFGSRKASFLTITILGKIVLCTKATFRSVSLDFRDMQQQFLDRVETASGKPVLLQSDTKFAGHATIKIAAKGQAAHLLLYKPEQESVLPYLVALSVV